ncbi:MAG: hypothetical protein BWX70_02084 [Verrucomicrobia bacterium ADurb.Bin070]|jgi:hypothetical protein|nr:MAG: hypothetical protein BWX70_02084 [Verrucomicrobia bacterium ADurb.Bin070]
MWYQFSVSLSPRPYGFVSRRGLSGGVLLWYLSAYLFIKGANDHE